MDRAIKSSRTTSVKLPNALVSGPAIWEISRYYLEKRAARCVSSIKAYRRGYPKEICRQAKGIRPVGPNSQDATIPLAVRTATLRIA